MKYYSQRDSRWGKVKINGTSSEMEDYGCFITCLAMMAQQNPLTTLKELEKKGGLYKDLVKSKTSAQILGLEFDNSKDALGRTTKAPDYICIAEVDFLPDAPKQQHFVIYNPDGFIIDPWTGTRRSIKTYKIINFRQFKNDKLTTKMKKKNQEFYDKKKRTKGWESLEDWVEGAREYREDREELEKQIEEGNPSIKKAVVEKLSKVKDDLDELMESI